VLVLGLVLVLEVESPQPLSKPRGSDMEASVKSQAAPDLTFSPLALVKRRIYQFLSLIFLSRRRSGLVSVPVKQSAFYYTQK
jgi:hypothetical protein